MIAVISPPAIVRCTDAKHDREKPAYWTRRQARRARRRIHVPGLHVYRCSLGEHHFHLSTRAR